MVQQFKNYHSLFYYQDDRFAFSKDAGIDAVFATLRMKINQVHNMSLLWISFSIKNCNIDSNETDCNNYKVNYCL